MTIGELFICSIFSLSLSSSEKPSEMPAICVLPPMNMYSLLNFLKIFIKSHRKKDFKVKMPVWGVFQSSEWHFCSHSQESCEKWTQLGVGGKGRQAAVFIKYLFIYSFIHLAVPGLSCGMVRHSLTRHPLTRDQTWTPCIVSTES